MSFESKKVCFCSVCSKAIKIILKDKVPNKDRPDFFRENTTNRCCQPQVATGDPDPFCLGPSEHHQSLYQFRRYEAAVPGDGVGNHRNVDRSGCDHLVNR